ncbi:hypothetical protein COZ84_01385 [Candidatus Kuenenbacteria bacterium CG_4_8_14_3_um_filter_39_15]|uniref:Uncharacterized protein n=1 Tax=Candidatus Kuenenbacteria bacterium CG_4_8_14_3_um_filter_39_15 TaxID=1974615 RepID=A0A2M7IM72_9BACT|nr:MAG: hypothetical protein COZ84_01385 [Candidatus Kuenenbacteria bacterium CG_4_8_14_3_um_filter_39_15]
MAQTERATTKTKEHDNGKKTQRSEEDYELLQENGQRLFASQRNKIPRADAQKPSRPRNDLRLLWKRRRLLWLQLKAATFSEIKTRWREKPKLFPPLNLYESKIHI